MVNLYNITPQANNSKINIQNKLNKSTKQALIIKKNQFSKQVV